MTTVHLNCVTHLTKFQHSKPNDELFDEERENTRSEGEKQRLLNNNNSLMFNRCNSLLEYW